MSKKIMKIETFDPNNPAIVIREEGDTIYVNYADWAMLEQTFGPANIEYESGFRYKGKRYIKIKM